MREQFKWFNQIDAIRLKSDFQNKLGLQNNEATICLTDWIDCLSTPESERVRARIENYKVIILLTDALR